MRDLLNIISMIVIGYIVYILWSFTIMYSCNQKQSFSEVEIMRAYGHPMNKNLEAPDIEEMTSREDRRQNAIQLSTTGSCPS